jgi:hypothetical protein
MLLGALSGRQILLFAASSLPAIHSNVKLPMPTIRITTGDPIKIEGGFVPSVSGRPLTRGGATL